MPKNIIIFSDGTGQAGGITFDEVRTNVYKHTVLAGLDQTRQSIL
jgi:hypothetical protein